VSLETGASTGAGGTSTYEALAEEPGRVAAHGPGSRGRRPIMWVAVAVGIVFSAFAVMAATRLDGPDPSFSGGKLLGEPAPDVELVSFDGRPLRLSDLAGRVIVVNFWNEWCEPCKEEYPSLVAFYERHAADDDFAMVGILRDSSVGAAERFLADKPMGWLVVSDPGDRAAVEFGTTGQPETFVIGPTGFVAALQRGPVTFDDLELMLAAGRGELPADDEGA
jgi:cytochrome c biogenesis protein CcmG, thiol:disulfide interchange protein DsbE